MFPKTEVSFGKVSDYENEPKTLMMSNWNLSLQKKITLVFMELSSTHEQRL